jgi:DNA-binding NarL/FixJ family response regulator
VTDISMPGLTGDDLLLEARRMYPDLRALVMSGYGPEVDLDRLGGAELTSVLCKPFRAADLDAAIETIFPSIGSSA